MSNPLFAVPPPLAGNVKANIIDFLENCNKNLDADPWGAKLNRTVEVVRTSSGRLRERLSIKQKPDAVSCPAGAGWNESAVQPIKEA